ncbi:Signal transduction histidine kinase [Aliiroseovarius halocynthiae]|uniref:histidine kinase n=1 Tax=Aliiroseovarius halocynthiae TaxID=985055 RepID=A0A545SQ99_9RHOB|nr:ATP-binding protein [Aliiroseovarius halocynthiae]TQV67134.1 sensor histidine kinase [Aliiroseovarius halocynthiae]SMR82138.1 Signal transduction histidine kinase [Aliiroseovarius halocynthiae]
MSRGLSIRSLGFLLILGCFTAAFAAGWMWFSSAKAWQDRLTRSYVTGIALYEALRVGGEPPAGIHIAPLDQDQSDLATQGAFSQLTRIPMPALVTNISIIGPGRDPLSGSSLSVGIVSNKLQYSVSELVSDEGQATAQKFGNVTRLLATYCGDPVLFARMGGQPWLRIDGQDIWGCATAPTDLRLAAVLLALVAAAILSTLVLDTSSYFDRFASALRDRGRLGGPESYAVQGPAELRETVLAVNAYLEQERAQISQRAMVLSGVSHDLGTPATRLRLRTALIKEKDLRQKLEADIDSMTEMIESVLTYTRAELNEETPRKLSLTSLVDALVADYQDMERPVSLIAQERPSVEAGRSVFATTSGLGSLPDQQRILITARPISLKRAISNLIDNALKYGRRASVQLTATPGHATIVVEDEGSGMSSADVEAVVAPFKRGDNTRAIDGFGLGLTIVATVAEQHGGRLYFETGQHGLRACLEICRR